MKKYSLIAVLSLCFSAGLRSQSTYTVNNTPGSSADYHVLQNALDSVPSGSILLLENSGLNYGQANINKPVVIYGAGYFLTQNTAPATQAVTSESLVSLVAFNAGSQGSFVSGLHIKDSANDTKIMNRRVTFNSTSNVTLSRCFIEPSTAFSPNYAGDVMAFSGCSGITIQQCYLICPNTGGVINVSGSPSTNVLLQNNLITGPSMNFESGAAANSSYIFRNNTFYGPLNGVFSAAQCQLFENNLVIITDTASHPNSNSGLSNYPFSNADHNVTNAKYLFEYDGNADNTNIIDVNLNIDSVFLHYSNPQVSSNDGIFQLNAGSIAKNASRDGTDAGAFGGSTPYVLSGIPAIPYAYSISVPSQAAGSVSVRIKARASN